MLAELVTEWLGWKENLTMSKKHELIWRKRICKNIFGDSKKKKQETITINAQKYRANNTTIMKIDEEALTTIYSNLSEEEKECITWTPKVKWKDIPTDSLLWDIITEKPSTPTFTVL